MHGPMSIKFCEYLNLCAWFIKNVSFEKKKITLRNKWHFVEIKNRY